MRRMQAVMAIVAVLALVALAAGSAMAGSLITLPRPGQVGLSVAGSYGLLLESGGIGEQFGSGAGMNVRLRYRARYERGWGLTFESHTLDVRDLVTVKDYWNDEVFPADSSVAYKKATVFLYGVDFYQMFQTRTKMPMMLSAGVGLAHPAFTLNDGETQYPLNDGPYLSVGAGFERFFWRSMAFDVGARYAAIFIGNSVNHDLHASVGIIYYASL
jgi:hypothetical protein